MQAVLADAARLQAPLHDAILKTSSYALSQLASPFRPDALQPLRDTLANMPSIKSAAVAATAILAGASSAHRLTARGTYESCPTTSSTPLSCHNTTVQSNTCCFNAPGGQLLQTQFWDTNPSTGPTNSWTIHGLWPDNCDGTYQSDCDESRAYTNQTAILQAFGRQDLLDYMQTYWKNDPNDGTDEELWAHEWETHGTCISSYDTDCYSNYTPTQEYVDFANRTVALFKSLNTYQFLANAGITPSSSTTYTASAINSALQKAFGQTVIIQCSGSALDGAYYTFNTRGSAQTGQFVPAAPDGSKSNCPSTGIQYLPKSGSSATTTTSAGSKPTTTTTSSGSQPTGGSGAINGKGYVNVVDSSGSTNGCLISNGKWYTSGTCATYTASNGQLTTSKGACQVSGSTISCASGNSASTFTMDSSDNIYYSGSSQFSAAQTASGSDQETVSTGSGNVPLTLQWQSM